MTTDTQSGELDGPTKARNWLVDLFNDMLLDEGGFLGAYQRELIGEVPPEVVAFLDLPADEWADYNSQLSDADAESDDEDEEGQP